MWELDKIREEFKRFYGKELTQEEAEELAAIARKTKNVFVVQRRVNEILARKKDD